MRLPLELTCCIIDLDEVALMEYCKDDLTLEHHPLIPIWRAQFDALDLLEKKILVELRSGCIRVFTGEDAAVFANVFGKQVKEWVNEQVLQWRKEFEENKDV